MLIQRTRWSVEELAQQIRIACERVDSLVHDVASLKQRENLSDAFGDLFILLEELRLAEKDIRVKNEELLSLREIMDIERDRYQELFELSPDAYFLTHPDLSIQQSNHASEDLLQIQEEQLLGLTLMLFIQEADHSLLRERLRELRKDTVLKGLEVHIQPRVGAVVDVALTVGGIYDAQGFLAGLHFLARDLTRQKKTEEALRLSEERFRAIAQTTRDAILIADDSGFVIWWNEGAQQMFGHQTNEAIGKPLAMLIGKKHRKAFEKNLDAALSSSQPNVMGSPQEMNALRKNGSEFPAEISLSSWTSGAKKFFGGIVRDITERKDAEETRMRLLERVLTAQEEDRRWIARELHDETGQSLSSLLVGLRMIEDSRSLRRAKSEAGRLRSITAQTLDDLGRLAKGLRPIVLDDLGLVVALKRHAEGFARPFGITVDFKIRGIDSKRLPLGLETAFFRIAQETLTNIAKHSGAKHISIRMEETEKTIEMEISDDGRGFDVEEVLRTATAANHLGIHGMRERAALLGGVFSILSTPQKGTSVQVKILKEKLRELFAAPGAQS